jgi:hypothetical protein
LHFECITPERIDDRSRSDRFGDRTSFGRVVAIPPSDEPWDVRGTPAIQALLRPPPHTLPLTTWRVKETMMQVLGWCPPRTLVFDCRQLNSDATALVVINMESAKAIVQERVNDSACQETPTDWCPGGFTRIAIIAIGEPSPVSPLTRHHSTDRGRSTLIKGYSRQSFSYP